MHKFTQNNIKRFLWAFLFTGLICLVTVGFYLGWLPNPLASTTVIAADKNQAPTKAITVKVIRPKHEKSVPIIADQIATVEPYFRADMRARASGIVKDVFFDIGDKVKKGDCLVIIDVPESEQEVYRCEAMILQRKQELKVSEAKVKDSKAARDVSAATIKQRLADVQSVIATRDLKKKKFARFQDLAAKGSVVGSVVEEEERDYLASEAAVTSANANVERARADFAESESKIEAANADVDLKAAQIEVARKDLDRAKAIANYGVITAPFDGVVVRRTVDPGSFVQNATTGTSEALISIAKVDLVTISAKFPDSIAPAICDNLPVEVTFDDMPGVRISAKVTRFAPTVQNTDHTMRVELDLFNGTEEEFKTLTDAVKKDISYRYSKGATNQLPVRAFSQVDDQKSRLIPGMTGTMHLTTGSFGNSYVIPSNSVYSRSGTSYILLVDNDTTRQVPVRVQMSDGKTARVSILQKMNNNGGLGKDNITELTGSEFVVIARQLEVGDQAAVKTTVVDW